MYAVSAIASFISFFLLWADLERTGLFLMGIAVVAFALGIFCETKR